MSEERTREKNPVSVVGRAIVIYAGLAFGLIEATDLLAERFGAPGWTFNAVLVALAIGLPVVLATAWASASGAREAHIAKEDGGLPLHLRLLTWRNALLGGVGAFALIGVLQSGSWLAGAALGPSEEEWARVEGLPLLDEYQDARDFEGGFATAVRVRAALPDDPDAQLIADQVSEDFTVVSEPAGARVSRIRWADAGDGAWESIGTTPMEGSTAQVRTLYRLELDGYDPWIGPGVGSETLVLRPLDHPLAGTVPVAQSSGQGNLLIPGFDHLRPPEAIPAFHMDRFEVTNQEYRAFVAAGGYSSSEYWAEALAEEPSEIDWAEAVTRFVDQTGRPGPATWTAGDFPDGTGAHPVTGISWFEAMAYAAFKGKVLPTMWHWNRAATPNRSQFIVPPANIDGDSGTMEVGASQSVTGFGAFDMAGNVREWVYNGDSADGGRFLLGGGWDDPEFAFNDAQAHDPWDRSPTNGFRLATYTDPDHAVVAFAQEPIPSPVRDFYAETPVSDEVFDVYRGMFAYDPMPLNATVEQTDTTEDYIGELVTLDAAYDGERLMAYIYRPVEGAGPFQTVIQFPGSGVIYRRESQLGSGYVDYIVKSGRAAVLPVYKGTLERGGDLNSDYPEETTRFRSYLIQWVQDFNRTIDYAESRPDLDHEKVAYFGFSWGGYLGGIIPAVAPRVDAVVLYVAGLTFQRALPEAEALNYLPRVTQPVIMINGEHDFFFPVELSQRPMFDLLGTPDERKKWVVYPGGHNVPREMLIKESLDWFDLHLGPTGGAVPPSPTPDPMR